MKGMKVNEYVWYFSEENKIAIVDVNQDWYWHWFCLKTPGVVRLGLI
jgi:hypothetical protein